MSYHPFERVCSLWFERVKNHFVIENYPFRYDRKKRTKYSPSTATTDFDLITYDLKDPKTLNVIECKSNINETSHENQKNRLLFQLAELDKYASKLPYIEKINKVKRWVFGIKIANSITSDIPKDVNIIEGEKLEKQVLNELVMLIAKDPKIDPKDDILSILRLLWHFGILNEKYYLQRTEELLSKKENKTLTASKLREKLGLINYKTDFCKEILNKLKNKNG